MGNVQSQLVVLTTGVVCLFVQLRSRCGELEKKLQETESADLAKLGQSIIQVECM